MLETKRPIVQDEYLESAFYSPDAHDAKKPHSKPGRKPAEGEPKLKRTAQNRAAQRAYRERKERKMLDLENKVKELELETIQAQTKSDFLQAQVAMLESELARYRGHGDFSDLRLPNKVGDLKTLSLPSYPTHLPTNKPAGLFDGQHSSYVADFPWSKHNLNHAHQQASSVASTTNSMSSSSPNDALVSPDSSILSGRIRTSKNAHEDLPVGKFDEKLDKFCTELNQACGTVSCPIPQYKRSGSNSAQLRPSSLNSRTNSSIVPQYPNSELGSVSGPSGRISDMYKLPLSSLMSPRSHVSLESNNGQMLQLDVNSVSENWLGESPALPLRNAPVSEPLFDADASATNMDFLTDPMFNGVGDFDFSEITAPNPFATEGNFDMALAFSLDMPTDNKGAHDPLSLLVDEESAYDPLTLTSHDKVTEEGRPRLQALLSIEDTLVRVLRSDNDEDSEEEVVPAPDHQVQCSEIWDRITSHARYTEIDIDGLCMELKAKAKCSEKGVVVNSKELDKIIQEKMSAA